MLEPTAANYTLLLSAFALLALVQIGLAAGVIFSLVKAGKERSAVHREMFGLMKKIEGLTSSRRDQLLKEYDKILESLTHRLPPIIASQASASIFETESRILTRLAELEPNLKRDDPSFKKMDDLIQSMERLEQTLVTSTAETVEKILIESRTGLLAQESKEFEA
jgi:hypothetical protein